MAYEPERHLPPFEELLTSRYTIPFFIYFVFFVVMSLIVRFCGAWDDYYGFRKYRLQNLTICVVHSLISGIWCLIVAFWNRDAMFNDLIHWYSPLAEQLPILSIAYFTHDAIHMLCHEWNRWTLELMVHHIATCFALSVGMLSGKFLLTDYWALMMEVSSIFVHLRTIMQLSGASTSSPRFYKLIVNCNIITFVVFRFAAQLFFAQWAWRNRDLFHPIYTVVGCGGEVVFCLINAILFVRILAADGFLGEGYKKKIVVNRDVDEKRKEE